MAPHVTPGVLLVSANLARAGRSEEAPSPGPGPLLSLVAAAVFPFDSVLAGMVAAGQGVAGICLYLGLSRAALDDSLVRLGLRTPHDRPLRKPGRFGWSAQDIMRLIVWRVAGVHPESIGERLGRNANAVRAKCRRLGVPTPSRKLLHRVDHAALVDPAPGFAAPALRSVQTVEKPPSKLPATVCGTAAGAAVWSGDAVSPVAPPSPVVEVPAPESPRPAPSAAEQTQRELALFRIVPCDDQVIPAPPAPVRRAPVSPVIPTPPAPSCKAPVSPVTPIIPTAPEAVRPAPAPDPLQLLMAGKRDVQRNEEICMAVALRYFAGQHYKAAARDAGISPGRMATLQYRLEIPRDLRRSKFGESYDEERGKANLERSGYEMVKCKQNGVWFFRKKKDRASVTVCRAVRKDRGLISEYDRYKSAGLCLLL